MWSNKSKNFIMGLHGKNLILFQVSTQTSRKITSGSSSRWPSLSQTQKKKRKKKKTALRVTQWGISKVDEIFWKEIFRWFAIQVANGDEIFRLIYLSRKWKLGVWTALTWFNGLIYSFLGRNIIACSSILSWGGFSYIIQWDFRTSCLICRRGTSPVFACPKWIQIHCTVLQICFSIFLFRNASKNGFCSLSYHSYMPGFKYEVRII